MWVYEKRLEFPVNIKNPDPKAAMVIISQYGGPDGEAAASMRYLSQRYSMPDKRVAGLLTDIGTEASEVTHSETPAFFRPACSKSACGRLAAGASTAPFTLFFAA